MIRSVTDDDLTLRFVALKCTNFYVTVVVHDGRVLEKPADEDEVRRNIAGYAVSFFGDSAVLSCRGATTASSSIHTRIIAS